MFKNGLLVAVCLITSQNAWAQQAPPVGAGALLQQIPQSPTLENPPPDLRVDRSAPVAAAEPGGPTIVVGLLHISGAKRFGEAQLLAVTGFTPNSELDLGGLRLLAAKITAFYNHHGYILARAYLPQQDITSGTVTINVIEGRFGQIVLDNRTRLADGTARGILSGLNSGDIVTTQPLERRLLLLSDVPGIRVRSTLSPGAAVGTSDLKVSLTPGPTITGSIDGDNAGNRYTGAYRIGATINVNNLAGRGDEFSLRGLTSFDGLYYGRASYQMMVGKATIGVAYSHIYYELGREFKSLDASGNGDVASIYASYPIIRSRNSNLYALVGVDDKWFEDKLGSVDTISHRRT